MEKDDRKGGKRHSIQRMTRTLEDPNKNSLKEIVVLGGHFEIWWAAPREFRAMDITRRQPVSIFSLFALFAAYRPGTRESSPTDYGLPHWENGIDAVSARGGQSCQLDGFQHRRGNKPLSMSVRELVE